MTFEGKKQAWAKHALPNAIVLLTEELGKSQQSCKEQL